MLNKKICKMFKVDEVDKFLVDYVDNLDDKLETESDESIKKELLTQKKIINKLRDYYTVLKNSNNNIKKEKCS